MFYTQRTSVGLTLTSGIKAIVHNFPPFVSLRSNHLAVLLLLPPCSTSKANAFLAVVLPFFTCSTIHRGFAPQVEVKAALPRLTDRRYRRSEPCSAFGSATFLGFLGRSLAGSRRFVNSKVFQLCTGFQFLPQPDGLCPSSCPRIP